MARFFTNPVRLFILIIVGFLCVAQADVKLRIYMQDGTLRSGTLINETDQIFVILSKTGREEVPKNKIMYVNGKSLDQWQARPDKLYQTEILPSEVPNPAYVNDKALPPPSLNAAPKVTAAAARPQNNKASLVPEKKVSKAPAEPGKEKIIPKNTAVVQPIKGPINLGTEKENSVAVTPPTKTVPVKQVSPVASPAPAKVEAAVPSKPISEQMVSQVPIKHRRVKNKLVHVSGTVAPTALKQPTPQAVTPNINGKYDRDAMGQAFYQSATMHLSQKEAGRALQDLHKSILLNKGDEKSFVLLGKIYEEEDLIERAHKYLSNPILKHNKEAQEGIARLEKASQRNEKESYVLYGKAGGGVVLAFVLAVLVGRLRRKTYEEPKTELSMPGITVQRDENKTIISAEHPAGVMSTEIGSILQKLGATSPPMGESVSMEVGGLSDPTEPDLKMEPVSPSPSFALSAEDVISRSESKGTNGKQSPPVETPSHLQEVARREREEILKAIAKSKEDAADNKFESTPTLPIEPTPISAESAASMKQHEELALTRDDFLRVAEEVDKAISLANESAQKGDLATASREYRTAMALDAGRIDCYLGLGFVHFQLGQWDMALHYYMRAIALNPDSADAHYGLGRVFLETDQTDSAIEELRKSFNLDATLTDAQDTLAMLGKTV